MIKLVKNKLYFIVATYFAFFAKLKLLFWKPKIIVITGSSGKTTLLHMVEAQLGNLAKYSHKANSSFGIPFDILDIIRKDLSFIEWPLLFLKAPLSLFKSLPIQKIYVVEADCDRPFEGVFLGNLLKPNITLWLNASKTHSINFEIKSGELLTNITKEFGQIAKNTKDFLIYNSDQENLCKFVSQLKVTKYGISVKNSNFKYEVDLNGSTFEINKDKFNFKYLLPEKTIYQILMAKKLVDLLELPFDQRFKDLSLPNGRSSIFKGVKNTILIDSTYNANLDSMKAVLSMFSQIKSSDKWVVLGDMLEQGNNEKEEHQKLAEIINGYDFKKVILMGPRVKNIVSPLVQNSIAFETPDKVLDFLISNMGGGELILFKGARFLEGVIEGLLEDKSNILNLVRREKIWQKRRERFGLK